MQNTFVFFKYMQRGMSINEWVCSLNCKVGSRREILTNQISMKQGIYSVPPPPVFFMTPPVTNSMLLHSTLLCKKIARAPGGQNNLCSLSWGGGAKQNRSETRCNGKKFKLWEFCKLPLNRGLMYNLISLKQKLKQQIGPVKIPTSKSKQLKCKETKSYW